MSEYTRYCAVPAKQSQDDVCATLAEQRIVSIVDDAPYFKNVRFNWIVVCLHDEQNLDRLAELFGRSLQLFVGEDWKTWELHLRTPEKKLTFKSIEPSQSSSVAELAAFFETDTNSIQPFLKAGGQMEFCKQVGVPYLEMLDQSISFRSSEAFKNFSVLAKNLG